MDSDCSSFRSTFSCPDIAAIAFAVLLTNHSPHTTALANPNRSTDWSSDCVANALAITATNADAITNSHATTNAVAFADSYGVPDIGTDRSSIGVSQHWPDARAEQNTNASTDERANCAPHTSANTDSNAPADSDAISATDAISHDSTVAFAVASTVARAEPNAHAGAVHLHRAGSYPNTGSNFCPHPFAYGITCAHATSDQRAQRLADFSADGSSIVAADSYAISNSDIVTNTAAVVNPINWSDSATNTCSFTRAILESDARSISQPDPRTDNQSHWCAFAIAHHHPDRCADPDSNCATNGQPNGRAIASTFSCSDAHAVSPAVAVSVTASFVKSDAKPFGAAHGLTNAGAVCGSIAHAIPGTNGRPEPAANRRTHAGPDAAAITPTDAPPDKLAVPTSNHPADIIANVVSNSDAHAVTITTTDPSTDWRPNECSDVASDSTAIGVTILAPNLSSDAGVLAQ